MLKLIKGGKTTPITGYTVKRVKGQYHVINLKTNLIHSAWKDRQGAVLCAIDLNKGLLKGDKEGA